MFSYGIIRTVLGTVLAAMLLAPAAAADRWGSNHQSGLDPAIRAAMLAHQTANRSSVRPDDRAGTRDVAGVTPASIPLDPAIRAAMLAHQTANRSSVRPDDRAGTHGPGLVSQPALVATTSDGIDWNNLGVGGGAALCALLLALGSAIGVRHAKARASNA
jgi:hypothetical protein